MEKCPKIKLYLIYKFTHVCEKKRFNFILRYILINVVDVYV